MITKMIEKIVDKIIDNLNDRRGIDFGAFDDEIIAEIKESLFEIIRKILFDYGVI